MKYGITPQQLSIIKTFFPTDYKVILFGSRISGNWKEFSDLDICIYNNSKVDMADLSFIREKFINSDLPFTVDLVDYNRCDDRFRNIIDTTGVNLQDLDSTAI